jgi:E3 ubiquitin-protein ligase SHPRH
MAQGQLKSIKSTLIVTPQNILYQWKREIARHAPGVTVFVYEGKARQQQTLNARAIAAAFAEHDVVLTTYDVLRSEVDYG